MQWEWHKDANGSWACLPKLEHTAQLRHEGDRWLFRVGSYTGQCPTGFTREEAMGLIEALYPFIINTPVDDFDDDDRWEWCKTSPDTWEPNPQLEYPVIVTHQNRKYRVTIGSVTTHCPYGTTADGAMDSAQDDYPSVVDWLTNP